MLLKKNFNFFKKICLWLPVLTLQIIKNLVQFYFYINYLFFNLTLLKKRLNTQLNLLSCISGVDLGFKTYRFSIVYDFISITYNTRVQVKVLVNETTYLFSIVPLFINANWWEREIWDLYGLYFENHPDLRRILTDYGFENHPLRKDFPLVGFTELRYNDIKKQIIVTPIEFSQEFRLFTFDTMWDYN